LTIYRRPIRGAANRMIAKKITMPKNILYRFLKYGLFIDAILNRYDRKEIIRMKTKPAG
jgi:hypothetical protein